MKIRIALILLMASMVGYGQNTQDSIVKTYHLGEVEITGFKIEEVPMPQTTKINYWELRKADAPDLSQLQKNIPSGRIRTNSRGESILFLRGAGERQLGLFFDGVPYNVPWDNRFDLTFLPLDVVGEISVNQNASSVLYGANVLGGAVNINTYERSSNGSNGSLTISGSNSETYSGSGSFDWKKDNFNFTAALSYLDSKGSILPANSPPELQSQDREAKYITNTQRKRFSLFTRGEWWFGESSKTGLSVNFVTGSKGVAPETHVAPADARLWRYPDWNRVTVSSNSKFKLNSKLDLTTVFWWDNFGQKIETYSDLSFSKITESQQDRDITLGGRASLIYKLNENHSLLGVVNFSATSHNEIILNASGGQISDFDYSQNFLSSGLEYSYRYEEFSILGGGVFDLSMINKTGAFTQYGNTNASAPGVFASAAWEVSPGWEVFAGVTYRNRFPSLRESFSGALNRFKANPDLKPEKGTLTDFGVKFGRNELTLKLSGFYNSYSDLISQIRLTTAQDAQRRRMRINLADATIIGSELVFEYKPSTFIGISGNLTYMDARGKAVGVVEDKLDNKPEVLGGITIELKPFNKIGISIESEFTGKQVETNPDKPSDKIEIAGSAVFNLRLSYSLLSAGFSGDVFFRVNNIFDQYRIYQLGLIEPGRSISVGITIKL
ncbi:MAG: TonB-dependent receptor [Ignavibacteriales bacterium]|nr:TonB-dependent receptor [Ignavibacteriales bacterium]